MFNISPLQINFTYYNKRVTPIKKGELYENRI